MRFQQHRGCSKQLAKVKAFVPRYRYDQLMRLGFLPISLVMVVIVAGVLTVIRG